MTAAIVFAVLSVLSNACSAVLQRLAVVDRRPGARPARRTAIDLVRQPVWLLGALFLIVMFGFQALALYFGPLSVVQPTPRPRAVHALFGRVGQALETGQIGALGPPWERRRHALMPK